MAYTIHQIDTAIRAIVGEFAGTVRLNSSRPHAMNDAAARAWIDQRPEDQHTSALREGLQDLTKLGHLNPIDGVFPDDRRPHPGRQGAAYHRLQAPGNVVDLHGIR